MIDEVLLSQVATAKNKRQQLIFAPRDNPSEVELRNAADTLGFHLPESYLQFCIALGIGDFENELRMLNPSELYAFDMPGVKFDGFIAISTDDCGNYLAFDPRESADNGELSVYYCCHDPFGFGIVAPSFGKLIQDLVDRRFKYGELIEDIPSFIEVDLPDVPKSNKPWWKLW
ncbi:SMI1/KNR4 family protein [Undibacterium flavidum]|uniref:SMI1/KNR4 family protein n=1 Tax=Undibacterium flavidum TaxID=2762297 RepID=A0ABR6Y9Q7_9BURK|nr:SMI1/KNR4 family protein [Undibacterium flavidum]MBC3873364.1 SMI1/KNR4 family protein [Undibacterium flavidum]